MLLPAILVCLVLGCAASNSAVNKEHRKLVSLEKKKHKLEKKYFILLGHLEKFPTDRELRLKQGEMRKEIKEIEVNIKQSREQLDLAIKEWEDRVVGERTEKTRVDKVIRQNSRGRYRRR
jgi:hypothetical protein